MDDKHLVAVIDFGSQYTQLIVRRVRELGYMAKLYALEDLDQIHEPGAVILSGGPKSTTDADAPDIDFNWLQSLNVPVLGVCYGMQLLNIKHGGSVKASNKREYGPAALIPESLTGLYQDMSPSSQVWMSHSDTVDHLAEGCRVIARNAEGIPVSLQWGETTFGIQFHPEVTHSHEGRTILRNFLSCAANLKKFDIGDFKRELIREIRERVGDKQVVCGVSGGVDSTVLAVLLHEAGVNMRAIFVDNGLLRKNEADEVRANFARMGVKIETVDASERFLTALAGEGDPEKKRRIIGGLFIDVFWDAVGNAEMLAQGTLYPDVIESASQRQIQGFRHQDAPQPRGTRAGASGAGEGTGTPGGTVQGRGPRTGSLHGHPPRHSVAPPLPRPRPGRALPRRGHQGPAGHHPGMRRHLHRQPEKIRLV